MGEFQEYVSPQQQIEDLQRSLSRAIQSNTEGKARITSLESQLAERDWKLAEAWEERELQPLLVRALGYLTIELEAFGGCDHEVNLCQCDLEDLVEQCNAAIDAARQTEPAAEGEGG